jgi:hypothetical protein
MSRWRGDDPVRRTNPTNEVVDVGRRSSWPTSNMPPVRRIAGGRVVDFIEVNLGIDMERAMAEARRCFNCGVCNDCELCLILCPDVAIRAGRAAGSRSTWTTARGAACARRSVPAAPSS